MTISILMRFVLAMEMPKIDRLWGLILFWATKNWGPLTEGQVVIEDLRWELEGRIQENASGPPGSPYRVVELPCDHLQGLVLICKLWKPDSLVDPEVMGLYCKGYKVMIHRRHSKGQSIIQEKLPSLINSTVWIKATRWQHFLLIRLAKLKTIGSS